jgi:hypothetical protein
MIPAGGADLDAGSAPSAFDTPQQRATTGLASILIRTKPGSRIPNIGTLRQELGVGAGTVQKALQELQATSAVKLDSRQRQGTYLLTRQLGQLWQLARMPGLRAVLPLPNSWEFQGLAAGLRAELDQIRVPATFLYAHGSAERVQALVNGVAQIAVMSVYAAAKALAMGADISIEHQLPDGTYYAENSVLVLAKAERAALPDAFRVGIDRLSADHTALTSAIFPHRDYVDVSYAQIPSALAAGVIDAAVWHRTALGLSLNDRGLKTWTDAHIPEPPLSIGAAAIVTSNDDPTTRAVIQSIDIPRLLGHQRSVVDGDVLPLY